MSKVSTNDITNILTAAATINDNFALLVAELDNVLSLDGTSPSGMQSNLDMNGYTIINSPGIDTVLNSLASLQLLEESASASADAAAASELSASSSAANAAASLAAIGASEINAATSAANALTSETAAAASEVATAADLVLTNADVVSADAAALTAGNAATAAAASETAAADSETAAAASETAAGLSETAAADSETAAAASETAAGLSAAEATTSAALSEAWAEGTLPGGVGTKSSKEWAGDAEVFATSQVSKIQEVGAAVSANALTLALEPTALDFRSATLGSGTVNSRTVAAQLSLVVPDTATLGTVSAVQSRLALLAIDNAGTIELAVVNIAGGNNLDETTLITTTAVDATSDSANVIYSTTARTDVPFRVVGYVESTQATAGTWATAPSSIQGYGGQAMAAMSSLGYGQTWQNVTRASGTTYYNTTGKPIVLSLSYNLVSSQTISVFVDSLLVAQIRNDESLAERMFASTIIPPGSSYSINIAGTKYSLVELR